MGCEGILGDHKDPIGMCGAADSADSTVRLGSGDHSYPGTYSDRAGIYGGEAGVIKKI